MNSGEVLRRSEGQSCDTIVFIHDWQQSSSLARYQIVLRLEFKGKAPEATHAAIHFPSQGLQSLDYSALEKRSACNSLPRSVLRPRSSVADAGRPLPTRSMIAERSPDQKSLGRIWTLSFGQCRQPKSPICLLAPSLINRAERAIATKVKVSTVFRVTINGEG